MMLNINGLQDVNTEKADIPLTRSGKGVSEHTAIEAKKTLLDYLSLTERTVSCMKSELYSNLGQIKSSRYILSQFYRFQACENAVGNFPYDADMIENKEVWRTTDEYGRKTTPYMDYDKNKLNYLINYYAGNGGNLSEYPFPEDEKMTQDAYKDLVKIHAGSVLDEALISGIFNDSGIDSCTVTIDAKGEVNVDSDNEAISKELKEKLMAQGTVGMALRNIIYRRRAVSENMSSETRSAKAEQTCTRWDLYRDYGVLIEDLSINEESEIEGLPEQVYQDYGTNPIFYESIKSIIRGNESSDSIIGTFVYISGNVYIN